jgi:hypothetical protein
MPAEISGSAAKKAAEGAAEELLVDEQDNMEVWWAAVGVWMRASMKRDLTVCTVHGQEDRRTRQGASKCMSQERRLSPYLVTH